jgi:hypothetical protein
MILFEHIMQQLHLNKGPEGAVELVRRPAGSTHALPRRDRHPEHQVNTPTDIVCSRGAQVATQWGRRHLSDSLNVYVRFLNIITF